MTTITIPREITGKEELVAISRKELERMKSQMMPTIFLEKSGARKLDKRVERGLKEYRTGKTERIETFLKREYQGLYQKYGS